MSGYLLDTSVALLARRDPGRLSPEIKAAMEGGPAFLSSLSFWEVMIKSQKGMLDVGDPRTWWAGTLDALCLQPLLHRPEHVAALYGLPPLHRDPFDRALVAQAMVENLTMLTTDNSIQQYASDRFRFLA